ncbi:Hpt domain-containing protein [Paracoccus sp. IB05]|uniref:Hpt domain-containing protein n=1 Tax=Paracoccus sp. IB05 TaxID=2779367 RepID=UPI0018E8C63F|nr:Hpt domain-containing protein [Paracoccus sp. IB05]MBJ2149587.1 Hpt domain-containing protein [Paracoccus sp. IB05]
MALITPAAGPVAAPRLAGSCHGSCDPAPDFDHLIDMTRLEELMDEIGCEDLSSITDLFLDETDAVITRVISSGNGPQMAEDLHFLKGCALNLGLRALAGICHDAERCNACGQTSPLNPVIFLAVYDASKLALLAALDEEAIR